MVDDTEVQEVAKRGPGRPPKQQAETVVETVYPSDIVLTRPHGFVGDDGNLLYWFQGQEVSDPESIKLLIDRGVEYEVKE